MTSSSLSERGYGCVRGWQEGEPDAGMRKGTIGFLSIVGYRKRYWVLYILCRMHIKRGSVQFQSDELGIDSDFIPFACKVKVTSMIVA